MASSTLRSATEAETGGVVLATDAIYGILIRLPAEELFRLRVVCQPWRSLLSDSQFIAAHAARHQGTLIVTGRRKSNLGGGIICCIQDLSGAIIKSILSKKDEWLISTQCNLACVARGDAKQCQLINLVTEERFTMPRGLSREHTTRRLEFLKYRISVAFGQVASTGEFKLLRVIDNNFRTSPCEQICEVLTHGDSKGGDHRWRGKKVALDYCVEMSPLSRVVIDGVVYFLLVEYVSKRRFRTKGIASFDLLTEEWRAILRRPAIIRSGGCHSLAALNGSLVLVDCSPCVSMDLWFLMDFEKGLWVKQHTVEINLAGDVDYFAHPLVILKNGRIVIYIRSRGVLTICNPRTNTCIDVEKRLGYRVGEVGLYTGNLLRLANDAI